MLQVDLNTCDAYIGEECQYSGDRLGEIDINILLEATRDFCYCFLFHFWEELQLILIL